MGGKNINIQSNTVQAHFLRNQTYFESCFENQANRFYLVNHDLEHLLCFSIPHILYQQAANASAVYHSTDDWDSISNPSFDFLKN